MTDCRAFRFRPAAVLEASGEDAFSFLQGQMSNDLMPAGPGRVTYGLLLSAKGKVEADVFVIQRDDGSFLLVSPEIPAGALRERLEAFIIADDVSLVDATQRWSGIAFWGEGADRSAELLGVSSPSGSVAHEAAGMIGFESRRWGPGTIEWLFEGDGAGLFASDEGMATRGMSILTTAGAELERIKRGGVAVPRELGSGDLPQEAGFEEFAVSFTKGCYIGQEVMARLKSMGRVRRGLIRVRGEGAAPTVPAELFARGRKVGELRSAAPFETGGFVGRAMATLTDLPEELAIGTRPDAQTVRRDDG